MPDDLRWCRHWGAAADTDKVSLAHLLCSPCPNRPQTSNGPSLGIGDSTEVEDPCARVFIMPGKWGPLSEVPRGTKCPVFHSLHGRLLMMPGLPEAYGWSGPLSPAGPADKAKPNITGGGSGRPCQWYASAKWEMALSSKGSLSPTTPGRGSGAPCPVWPLLAVYIEGSPFPG